MRILHCTDTYPPQVNGVSVVTSLTIDGLLARGVDVGLIAPAYPPGAPSVFGSHSGAIEECRLPAVDLPFYKGVRVSWPSARAVEQFVRRFRPDVVHADTEFVVGRLGARAARRLAIPLVTSFHTDFAQYTASYGMPWLRGPVTRSLVRFHRQAARILTPSVVTADWLRPHGLANVEVWGRAVDTRVFHPIRHARPWRERLAVGDATLFLHVGRLALEKNVQLLLDGFAMARAELGGRARMVIAGDGPAGPALRAAAPEGVDFVGFLDREKDLPALYASADAFLCASTTETLGLVILEAMASGLPVIAVAAGGIADHLRHFANGLAVAARPAQFAAAIVELTEKPTLRARLGVGAREWAVRLGWDGELDRLVEVYRQVANSTEPTQRRQHGTAA